MGGAIQLAEDDSSIDGDGESIAASEMDTDTVRTCISTHGILLIF